ncbi:MAG: hypothetical protein A2018_00060 [Alphaproteobacteria bacterium GWF2_58_20]|nr:MAG: hypothetical protein A2018_00060 [Alphaproteobacteria bacterium GWF2_58_20]
MGQDAEHGWPSNESCAAGPAVPVGKTPFPLAPAGRPDPTNPQEIRKHRALSQAMRLTQLPACLKETLRLLRFRPAGVPISMIFTRP